MHAIISEFSGCKPKHPLLIRTKILPAIFTLTKHREFGPSPRYRGATSMAGILDNPVFEDDDLAREWFEARIWPNGPVCPHCGSFGEGVTKLFGAKHRPGLF